MGRDKVLSRKFKHRNKTLLRKNNKDNRNSKFATKARTYQEKESTQLLLNNLTTTSKISEIKYLVNVITTKYHIND